MSDEELTVKVRYLRRKLRMKDVAIAKALRVHFSRVARIA